MQIILNLPDTDIVKDIIRAAKWEDKILFDTVLRGAIKDATILPDDCEILTKEAYADLCMRASKNDMSVLEDIKSELWMEGMNMGGEYQGVWVRFKDIEKAIDKHCGKEQE